MVSSPKTKAKWNLLNDFIWQKSTFNIIALLSIQTQCCQSQQILLTITVFFRILLASNIENMKLKSMSFCTEIFFLPSLLTFDICMPYTYFYTLCLSYTNSHDDNKYTIHYIMYIYVENWRCHNFLIFADNNTKYILTAIFLHILQDYTASRMLFSW